MAQQPPAPPPPPPPPPPPEPPPPSGPVYGGGAVYGARPGGVTAASVLLFVVGGLRSLIYLLGIVLIVGARERINDYVGGEAGGLIAVAVVFALVALAAGILQIVGGANLLRLRRRGRVLGLVGTVAGLALIVFGLLSGGGGTGGAILLSIVLLAGDIAIIVLLSQNARYLTNP